MSYGQGGYDQGGQQGYGSYNPYGQTGNPYGRPQQEQPYGHTGNYSERLDLEHQSGSRYDEESAQGGYEMSNMNGRDPNRILNEVRNLDRSIDDIEARLQQLKGLHKAYLESTDTSPTSQLATQIDVVNAEIMADYRGLTQRVNTLRQDPEAMNPRNKAQVGKVERRLKTAINQCQQVGREYRQASRDQIKRQYRIVRPDASEAEVQEVVEDSGNQQVFSTALISGDRRGQAQSVQRTVNARHRAIQKIESDMMELAQLYNDLEALVVQQDAAVTQIEEKGMEATGNVQQANTELDSAVKSARAARKKKWMCLGIALLIIIIIVVVVVVVVKVTQR